MKLNRNPTIDGDVVKLIHQTKGLKFYQDKEEDIYIVDDVDTVLAHIYAIGDTVLDCEFYTTNLSKEKF